MVCTKTIGRKYSLLVGKEATAWTIASAFTAIPLTIAPFLNPIVEKIRNDSWIGTIEDANNSYVTKTMTETSVEWIVHELTFGHLLTAAFWASAAPATIETWVYKHSFSVQNDNCHQSYSLIEDWLIWEELALYNLINTLGINLAVWEIARFTWDFMWQIYTWTTGHTPAFTAENPFKISNMVIKLADDIASLWAAPAINVRSLNFEIAKNVVDIFESWNVTPSSFANQQFGITWDVELTYENDTLRDRNTGWTKQAMSILIQGDSLIGATEKAELYFEFSQLSFDEWDRSNTNDEILTETLWFSAEYKIADTAMVTGYLQNTQSTQY